MMKAMQLLVLLLGALVMPAAAYAQNISGDVNGDGTVNITDVNAVINIILGGGYNTAADVNNDGGINIADLNVIIGIILGDNEPPTPGHEYVDLGLPSGTMWATMNVGANSPEGYGDYFAWGETAPKTLYNWETYKWGSGSYYSEENITKYGTGDGKTELDLEDDAAYVNWGELWCMPTLEQINELVNNCTWERTTINGVNGQLVTGPNGNTLFLPAAAWYENDNEVSQYSLGDVGDYWSRTLESYRPQVAFNIRFNDWGIYVHSDNRSYGRSVRAVRMRPTEFRIEQESLDCGVVPIGDARSAQLTITNTTPNALTLKLTIDEPFLFKQEEGGASSMTIVLPGNSCDSVPVMFTATMPGEFNGHVTVQNTADDAGRIGIPVHARAYYDIVSQDEDVDLGLPSGTLWATRNIGADSPEGYGDYFAWGETAPKESYLWTNYKWCTYNEEDWSVVLTKYCLYRDNGTIDNKRDLELEDDAAYVNWGQAWRMPTPEQQRELAKNCFWIWTSRNGVNGYLVIGPNGNSLFMPAAGFYSDELRMDGLMGTYWSRGAFPRNSSSPSAYALSIDSIGRHAAVNDPRFEGNSVRAVRVSPANSQGLHIEQQSLDMAEAPIGDIRMGELAIINNSTDAVTVTASVDEPFSFKQDENSVSSITVEIPGKSCAPLMVMFTSTTAGEFNGNVTLQSSELEGGQTVIPVHASAFEDFPPDEYVDLGLPSGTLWATRNIGADSPVDQGDYFAWGETAPKNVYSWSTYKWCDGNWKAITKYCTDSGLGTVDGKTELELEDDAAYVNLGASWRIPSLEQMEELLNQCTKSWTTLRGVKGYLFTGPNGNTLFLPAAGYRTGTSLNAKDIEGDYWTRNLDWSYSGNAFYLHFTQLDGAYCDYNIMRCPGVPIRPVYQPQD